MGILLSINLQGNVSGPIRSTTEQKHTVQISKGVITSKILHTDRTPVKCVRKLKISDEIENFWKSDNCPDWEKSKDWKKYSKNRRIISHVNSFNEGYGVTFEEF